MVVQFLKSLVEAVDGREEGDWIGDVDRYRHVQPGTRFPHGVEARVVTLHPFARGNVLPQIKAEGLQNLQSPRSVFVGLLDSVGLNLGIARVPEEFIAGLGEGVEASRMRAVELRDRLGESFTVAASEVD